MGPEGCAREISNSVSVFGREAMMFAGVVVGSNLIFGAEKQRTIESVTSLGGRGIRQLEFSTAFVPVLSDESMKLFSISIGAPRERCFNPIGRP